MAIAAMLAARRDVEDLYQAAFYDDTVAVLALARAGADPNMATDYETTPIWGAICGDALTSLKCLVERCEADLGWVQPSPPNATALHLAAREGSVDIVEYVAGHSPHLIESLTLLGTTPVMEASRRGMTSAVRHLARLGCSLSHEDNDGDTALDWARREGHHDTAQLLSAIDSAGSWRQYAAACRMAYVRIRHEVSTTYAVLDDGHDDRELFHLVFGRNRAFVTLSPRPRPRLEEVSEDSSEKPKAMLELPDVVFRLVCRFLV